MKILVTGGTIFLSKFTAKYFLEKGHTIYVLNRGNNEQLDGVIHIKADRNNLSNILKDYYFDVVLDINGYTKDDVKNLHSALGDFGLYVFISSSAVYKEDSLQPFKEDLKLGYNNLWKDYGYNKILAEEYIKENIKDYYILRPPYLYGPMNIVYREAFVFECVEKKLPFYIPNDGSMKLQFFYVKDLCKIIENIIKLRPDIRIYNVGNKEVVTINTWVKLCYKVLNKTPNLKYVKDNTNQRNYFPFLDYSYELDTKNQDLLLTDLTSLEEGLMESYLWYKDNKALIRRKPLLDYINENFK